MSNNQIDNVHHVFKQSDFVRTGTKTAGKSASYQAKMDDKLYQVKFSNKTRDARRILGLDKDVGDIIGEFITSKVFASLSNKEGGMEITPECFLVKGESDMVSMASRYLNSGNPDVVVMNIDDFFVKAGGKIQGKHAIISGASDGNLQEDLQDGKLALNKKYKVNIRGQQEEISLNREEIYKSIKLSMLMGNHDVNPGNMMVLYNVATKETHVGSIDFGNAFNNLIKDITPGGGYLPRKDPDKNFMIDAFNRTSINGLALQPQLKFRRDYKDVMLDPEFIMELKKDNIDMDKLAKAMVNAKEDIRAMVKDEPKYTKEVIQALITLAERVGNPLDAEIIKAKNVDIILDKTFENLGGFVNTNLMDQKKVADVLSLQADIEEALTTRAGFIGVSFINLASSKNAIEWVRLDNEGEIFKGDLREYILHRGEQLKANNKDRVNEINKNIDLTLDAFALAPIKPAVEIEMETFSAKKKILDTSKLEIAPEPMPTRKINMNALEANANKEINVKVERPAASVRTEWGAGGKEKDWVGRTRSNAISSEEIGFVDKVKASKTRFESGRD